MVDESNDDDKKAKSLFSSFRAETKEWASSTSFHGFPNLARSENIFMTVVWIICFSGSTGYCAFSIYTSIVSFFQYNVVTTIQNVYENPALFPTVTFCNLNAFATNEGLQYAKDVMAANYIYDVVSSPLLESMMPHNIQGGINTYMSRNVVTSNAKNEPASVQKTFGFSLNKTIPMCYYHFGSCNFSNFNWFYSSGYGNCYQFNAPENFYNQPNDLIYTYKTGSKYALSMLIFTGLPRNVNSLSLGEGGHLFVHNRSAAPDANSGIDFQPGVTTNVVISRIFSQQLPQPYNDCYEGLTTPDKFDSFFYRETLKSGYTYTQVTCFGLIEQSYYIKSCNCSDPGFATLYGTRYCETLFETFCVYNEFFKIYGSGANKDWSKYCPLECSTEQYVSSISSSAFPSKSFADILLNNTYIRENLDYIGAAYTLDSIYDNYAYVNVYYDYTGYTLITEAPAQELVDLLSSVGGTMGLYIGISFLSFVEVFELLVQLILVACRHVSKASKVSAVPTKPV